MPDPKHEKTDPTKTTTTFAEFVETLDMNELDRLAEQDSERMLDELAWLYERAGISKE